MKRSEAKEDIDYVLQRTSQVSMLLGGCWDVGLARKLIPPDMAGSSSAHHIQLNSVIEATMQFIAANASSVSSSPSSPAAQEKDAHKKWRGEGHKEGDGIALSCLSR